MTKEARMTKGRHSVIRHSDFVILPSFRHSVIRHSHLFSSIPQRAMSAMLTTIPLELRTLTRRDIPDLLAIERASYSDPWGEATFDGVLRSSRSFAIAASLHGELRGYLIGEQEGGRAQILNLCVEAGARRRGVGSRLIAAVARHLRRRQRLVAIVAEMNVAAQLFYRSRQFHAVTILRHLRPEVTHPDAYLFEYRPGEFAAPFMPANRVFHFGF
jgi:ribosomal-protein-alanine N-acetyltransferase